MTQLMIQSQQQKCVEGMQLPVAKHMQQLIRQSAMAMLMISDEWKHKKHTATDIKPFDYESDADVCSR